MYCAIQPAGDGLQLTLRGVWRAADLPAIDRELGALPLAAARSLEVRAAEASFDLSGAWLLHDFLRRMREAGTSVHLPDGAPTPLPLIDKTLAKAERATASGEAAAATDSRADLVLPGEDLANLFTVPAVAVESLGRRAVRYYWQLISGFDFVGRSTTVFCGALLRPRHLRLTSIARHVYDTGITAVPIVSLIAFLISVILAYMGAQQLRQFGADLFVVDLVTIGVLRELGVLLTAIIVAGRSGSAFAAEIGAMRLNDEVDALEATGVDPVEVLVLPRLLGLLIALPLLTIVADLIGLVGGALLCHALLDMPLTQYLSRANEAIASTTFWAGISKAPVFAILIALAGTWYGMGVHGSSRHLGKQTTAAVVAAIFLVILADALFAMLYMELDI